MALRLVTQLVAPVRCGGCGDAHRPTAVDRHWCEHCRARWGPAIGRWVGDPGGCDGWAAAAYGGPVRRAILAGKVGAPSAAIELLLDRWPAGRLPTGAVVTWIPGHPLRTFATPDSGPALARALAAREEDELGVAVRGLLVRSPFGRRQARRSSEDRRAGAGRLGLRVVGASPPTVVLVDDVRTTGASLDHAAGLLRAAGAREVFALTVAAAPSELDR